MITSRRQFIGMLSAGIAGSAFSTPSELLRERQIDWYNLEDWGVEGKGWQQTNRYYDRLPAKAENLVREPVWRLSQQSAGMCAFFESDATSIYIRYSLRFERLAMPHMPATGVSGVDLYAKDDNGLYRWAAVVRPTTQQIDTTLVSGLKSGKRSYLLYLPLYNGIENIEIGVENTASLSAVSPRQISPIVFYGTSILHGACASRPGMAWPSILGRRLDIPIINLGFSGNGRMEFEIAELLAELETRAYVIDCLPNMRAEMINERAEPFIKHLRLTHPETPIILLEDRTYADARFKPERYSRNMESRQAFRKIFRALKNRGDDRLFYVSGDSILGIDGESTTDGSHPNDLGMVEYANIVEPVIRNTLSLF